MRVEGTDLMKKGSFPRGKKRARISSVLRPSVIERWNNLSVLSNTEVCWSPIVAISLSPKWQGMNTWYSEDISRIYSVSLGIKNGIKRISNHIGESANIFWPGDSHSLAEGTEEHGNTSVINHR